jgi:hypothetical protein
MLVDELMPRRLEAAYAALATRARNSRSDLIHALAHRRIQTSDIVLQYSNEDANLTAVMDMILRALRCPCNGVAS